MSGKGNRVDQFETGQRVKFVTNHGSHAKPVTTEHLGRISKLHRSGSQGVAEIFPEGGGKKLSRRLQCVSEV